MASVYEFIYPTENSQTKFVLRSPIAELISVYKNGDKDHPISFTLGTELVIENGTEVEQKYIETNPLEISSYLIAEFTTEELVTGNYKNVLFKQYGGSQRLLYNQNYKVKIEEKDINVDFNFTSRYDPLYCATKLVKEDISPVVALSDEDINFIIYNSSMKILVAEQGSGDLNYSMPVPYTLSDPKNIPYNIQMRVRYMSDVDILYAVYLQMTGKKGRHSKKLANMAIEKEVSLPYLKDFLSGFRQKLSQYEGNLVKTAVKGELFEPYPITPIRRSF